MKWTTVYQWEIRILGLLKDTLWMPHIKNKVWRKLPPCHNWKSIKPMKMLTFLLITIVFGSLPAKSSPVLQGVSFTDSEILAIFFILLLIFYLFSEFINTFYTSLHNHLTSQSSYLSALDFWHSPVWNFKFDELDFFPSLNWIFTACVACKNPV